MIKELFETLELSTEESGVWSPKQGRDIKASPANIETFNPATGELLSTVAAADEDAYEKVIQSSQEIFNEWRKVPAPKRGEAIRLVTEEIRKHKDALGTLIALEMGKIKAEGDGEVQEMIDMGDMAVGLSRRLYGKIIPSERPEHRMIEQWHPYGPVGIISAFNFPMAVWSWNAFLGAICGNTCIWKPSAKVPLCAIAVQRLCNRVFKQHALPPIFQLLIDHDNGIAKKLVRDSRVPLISFTGSTAVGKEVASVVASRLGKSILELGGNNALIVDDTADLNMAVPSIAFGACGTAGQRCTTTRRALIHKNVFGSVTQSLINAYEQIVIGDPTDAKTLVGPLIDDHAVHQFDAAITQAKAQGGKILCGGTVIKGDGHFVTPTIISIDPYAEVIQHETFAPILYVSSFEDLDEAIAIQNSVPQGLSSSLFTNNLQHAEMFLAATGSDCGIANINAGTSGAEIGGAFGGEKDTGGGREAGTDSWRSYMRRQTSTINWGDEQPLAQGIKFL